MKRIFTSDEVRKIGEGIGIDFNKIDLEQFRLGLTVELEHGKADPETNVTNDDIEMTGKITWAHLKEMPNYYSSLSVMEKVHERDS